MLLNFLMLKVMIKMNECIHEWEETDAMNGISCKKCGDSIGDYLVYLNDTEEYVFKLKKQIKDMKLKSSK